MPHCDTCERFYNPNTLRPDGTCPTCGRPLAELRAADSSPASTSAPWHFKAMIGATAIYLGYRLFQGVVWVGHHL